MEAFKYLGLNPDTINKEMAKDAEGTIVKVLEKIDKLKAEDKSAVLNDLFGEQAIDSVATLANNIDKVKKNLALAHSEMTAGSVDKEYANRMNTLKNIFEQTKNTLVNGLADIGEAIGPQLKESLKGWSETFKSWGNFAKSHPKLMAGIIKVVGAIAIFNLTIGLTNRFITGPLTKSFAWFLKFGKHFKFGGLMHALKKMFPLTSRLISGIIKIFKFLGGKFIGLIKIVGTALKVAFTANPIGMIIVAIIAVIGIFVVLYKKCEWFRNMVNAVWKAIKDTFSSVWEWIKEKFNALVDIGANAWNGLKESGAAIIDKIKDAFKGFFDWLHNKWEDLKSLGSKLNPFNWFGKKDNSIPQNYSGTNYFGGGLTTLAERGAELVEVNNNSYLIASQMLANLPRGAKILNNSQTRKKIEGINKNNNKIPFNLKKLYQVSKNILIKNSYKNKKVVNSETKNIQNYALKNSYNLKKDKETPKTNSLSSRVLSLKDRIKNISNSNLKTTIGGDTITVNIYCNSENKIDIAREVKKVFEEIQSKKRRTAIV